MGHGERHFLHDVGEFHLVGQGGDAHCSEQSTGDGEHSRSPLDGGDVACLDESDVGLQESARDYGDDVHCHHDGREQRTVEVDAEVGHRH